MINKEDKLQIIEYFNINMRMVIISKIYNVSPPRIRQILIEELGEEKFKQIRAKKIQENDIHYRYHNDIEYRNKIIDRAKKRYHKLKV